MALMWHDGLSLGLSGMDGHHRDFLAHLAALEAAAPAELAALFQPFLEHLTAHFEYEEALMDAHGFPAARDHRAEHLRILAEAREVARSLGRGRTLLAIPFVRERIPQWFLLHRDTMDLAAATFLRGKGLS